MSSKGDKCGLCKSSNPPAKGKKSAKKTQNIGWLCCDSCSVWFHFVCVRISNALSNDIQQYTFFCENCSIRGNLILKPSIPTSPIEEIEQLNKTILELAAELKKLSAELDNLRSTSKKQFDRMYGRINQVDQRDRQQGSQNTLVDRVEENLQIIEEGAKLANTCAQQINSSRLAINKVPFHYNENVRTIVQDVMQFLGLQEMMCYVSNSFRLQVRPSKWTDRTLTPTIVVIFDNRESRDTVLRRYFEKHKNAKLCQLKHSPALEYRFTINEVLSPQTFRLRNLAIRFKQKKLVRSVFVRNDSVSVLFPNHKRYTPIVSTTHLLELVGNTESHPAHESSSIFFDALSANLSASTNC